MTPKLTTFVSKLDSIKPLLALGVEHLILEHPEFSSRCLESDSKVSALESIQTLIQEAKSSSPTIKMSFNCDPMVHENHFEKLSALFSFLVENQIEEVRLQDVGLIPWVKSEFPSLNIKLALEPGNLNTLGMQGYVDIGVSSFLLNNELPYSDIKTITGIVNAQFELQIHGPILIQYSKQRFLANIFSNQAESSPPIRKDAIDEDLPSRKFHFLDTQHGHFMFAQFNRCLYQPLKDIYHLPIQDWVIDTRLNTEEEAFQILKVYRNALLTLYTHTDWAADSDQFKLLKECSDKPLRTGFFTMNNTDRDWRNKKSEQTKHYDIVAKVIDCQRGKSISFESEQGFSHTDKVVLVTPELKELPLALQNLRDIENNPTAEIMPDQLGKCDWVKGSCIGSQICKIKQ